MEIWQPHLQQTDDDGGLAADLGHLCKNLSGKVELSKIDNDLATMIWLLAGTRHTKIDCSVLQSDFINFWKGAREGTSLSVSGRHFGHYKAAVRCAHLVLLHSEICNIACASGTPLRRWKRCLNCMLEKKPGVVKVEKLHAILLMEAEFNFVNKLIFGSRMLCHVEAHFDLPDENAGSRQLTGDRIRLLNRPRCIILANAHTCYDRILQKFVILVCMSMGVPYPPLAMMFSALSQMEYSVWTKFGDSASTRSSTEDHPFQGVCQGNRAGPAIWLLVSLTLVRFMHRIGQVCRIRLSMSGVLTMLIGFMFVDDTDCWRI